MMWVSWLQVTQNILSTKVKRGNVHIIDGDLPAVGTEIHGNRGLGSSP